MRDARLAVPALVAWVSAAIVVALPNALPVAITLWLVAAAALIVAALDQGSGSAIWNYPVIPGSW